MAVYCAALRRTILLASLLLAVPACKKTVGRELSLEDQADLTSAGPGVRALLGGLEDGAKLGDLRVVHVLVVWDGAIRIDTTDDEGHNQRLLVNLVGDGPLPPATSKKYAVFFGSPRPDAGPPPAGDRVGKAIEALADVLRKTEDTVAQPAGMKPYGAVRTSL